MTKLLMKDLNVYTPHEYAAMSDREREIARKSFVAGWNHRDSIAPDEAVRLLEARVEQLEKELGQ